MKFRVGDRVVISRPAIKAEKELKGQTGVIKCTDRCVFGRPSSAWQFPIGVELDEDRRDEIDSNAFIFDSEKWCSRSNRAFICAPREIDLVININDLGD